MRNLLLERHIINEGYFNNVEQDVNIDDIQYSENDIEVNKDVTEFKYYFEIVYASTECRNTKSNNSYESYIVNIKDMYKKIVRVFDAVDIVYDYYIAPPAIYDTNYIYFKPKEFSFPLPEEFDIIKYIDSVNGNKHSAQPKYTFRIYFNEFPKYSFKAFRLKIEHLKKLCFKLFMKYTNDGGSISLFENDGTYLIPMNIHKKTIGYEIGFTSGLINSAVKNLYRDVYNTTIDDYTDYDEQLRIKKCADFNQIQKHASLISKEKYNLELIPIKYHKATFKPWQDIFSWFSFDLNLPKTHKNIDLADAEICVYNSVMTQIPLDFLLISTIILFIRINGKLIIPEDDITTNGRIFNEDTLKQYGSSPMRIGYYEKLKAMSKIRKCCYRTYGCGHEFYIFFCDKNGNIMRNYDKYRSNSSQMWFDDTVLKCLRDGKAWK